MTQKSTESETPVSKVVFTKSAILETGKYAHRRDLLEVLLKDNKSYSFEAVDVLISSFMKGKVK